MAAQTAVYAQHATLSGTTADTITFSGGAATNICVTNRDATNTLYFTIDGTTPVAAADETFVVLPLQFKVLPGGPSVVKVVGNGGGYSVERF